MAGSENPFSERYIEELRGAGEDHDPSLAPFANGWVDLQEQSGLTPHVYLNNFEDDLKRVLFYYGINYQSLQRDKKYHAHASVFADHYPNSTTAQMLDTTHPTRLRNLFEKRVDEEDGFPLILFMGSLGTTLYTVTNSKGPEAALERLEETSLDDQMKGFMHQELDKAIFLSMINDRDPERGADKARLASSEVVARALRAGFDRRLIYRAIRTKGEEKRLAIEHIIQLASTDVARDRILGFLAMQEEATKNGRRIRSRHDAMYRSPANDEFLRNLMHERLMREFERSRREHEEWRRQHEETMREHRIKLEEIIEKLRQKYGDEYVRRIFPDNPLDAEYRTHRGSSAQVAMSERVTRAIGSAHHTVRGTLLRLDRQTIASVIEQVDELRIASPEITERRIIGHFHHKGQLADATDHDLEIAKIIHLLSVTDKGQPLRLCI